MGIRCISIHIAKVRQSAVMSCNTCCKENVIFFSADYCTRGRMVYPGSAVEYAVQEFACAFAVVMQTAYKFAILFSIKLIRKLSAQFRRTAQVLFNRLIFN